MTNEEEKILLRVSFLAEVKKENLKEISKDFQKYGAEIISNEFSELGNIGNFHIEEIDN